MKNNKMPDQNGYFGQFGGRFVPDTLMSPLLELEEAYLRLKDSSDFQSELSHHLKDFVGRPTPLQKLNQLTQYCGGAQIYMKREDLAYTGAHKINNAMGQILLAKHMGKKRIIAETGAGQHGVATASVAAAFGFECVVYMGAQDIVRQAPNVQRMKMLGAHVCAVSAGAGTLKDAVSEAMRDWVTNVKTSYYLLGSALGPHPYPMIVRDFQSVIGKEARLQVVEKMGRLPDYILACVGGGSNAIGIFSAFIDDPDIKLIGVEAGGEGVQTAHHAARFSGGRIGIFQGMKTYLLQNSEGQIAETASVSAGLDYAGIGPEHAYLLESGRAFYASATDEEAIAALQLLAQTEGILAALESAHAVAYVLKLAPTLGPDQTVLVNLSGRGDKDLGQISAYLEKRT